MVESRQKKVVTEKTEIELLREQVDALTKLVGKQTIEPIKKEDIVEENDDATAISSDTYIKVMSLTPYYLTLTTQEYGRGKKFNFEKFGEVKRILYHDLVDIMEQHANFLEEGYYIIMNSDVLRKHGLDDLYSKILSKDMINRIIEGNDSDAVNLFKSCGKSQRENIVTILLNKMLNDEFVDLNLLDRMSRVVGYNISERYKEMKDVREANKA